MKKTIALLGLVLMSAGSLAVAAPASADAAPCLPRTTGPTHIVENAKRVLGLC